MSTANIGTIIHRCTTYDISVPDNQETSKKGITTGLKQQEGSCAPQCVIINKKPNIKTLFGNFNIMLEITNYIDLDKIFEQYRQQYEQYRQQYNPQYGVIHPQETQRKIIEVNRGPLTFSHLLEQQDLPNSKIESRKETQPKVIEVNRWDAQLIERQNEAERYSNRCGLTLTSSYSIERRYLLKSKIESQSDLEKLPTVLQSDKDFLIALIKRSPRVLQYISNDFRQNKTFLMEVVYCAPLALEYVPEQFQNDIELQKRAVKSKMSILFNVLITNKDIEKSF